MSIRSFTFVRSQVTLLASLLSSIALPQSFNIDLDVNAGGYAAGSGVPSSTFGAAANQPGFWSRRSSSLANLATRLYGLDGQLTNVTMDSTSHGGGGGSGWIGNDGDYRLLLNDYTRVPSFGVTFTFNGLARGRYRIVTYAIDSTGIGVAAEVTVPGADHPFQLSGQGSMPGNEFVVGVTHCIHEVSLLGSALSIIVRSRLVGPPDASVNGFQIVAVPELGSGFSILCALTGFVLRRHNLGRGGIAAAWKEAGDNE